jgi:uncharacterized protein (DUF2344 family)
MTRMTRVQKEMDLSAKEVEKFNELSASAREIVETATMRIGVRIESLDQAQKWYTQTRQLFLDAIVSLTDDPHDDFETAFQKARKLDAIETDFESASNRLNFELREAQKMGIAPTRGY